MSDKQMVMDAVQDMSDTATISQIIEDMAILAALRRAEADSAAGRVLSHEEVCRRSETWIGE